MGATKLVFKNLETNVLLSQEDESIKDLPEIFQTKYEQITKMFDKYKENPFDTKLRKQITTLDIELAAQIDEYLTEGTVPDAPINPIPAVEPPLPPKEKIVEPEPKKQDDDVTKNPPDDKNPPKKDDAPMNKPDDAPIIPPDDHSTKQPHIVIEQGKVIEKTPAKQNPSPAADDDDKPTEPIVKKKRNWGLFVLGGILTVVFTIGGIKVADRFEKK